MNKRRKSWSGCGLCAGLILCLFLTVGNVSVFAAESIGDVVYDDHDIVIEVTDVMIDSGYYIFDYDVTNNGSEEVQFGLYPLKINDAVIVSEGTYSFIGAGETAPVEVFLSIDELNCVGITSAWNIQGCLSLSETEYYEQIIDPEMVTLFSGEKDGETSAIEHSDQIIYDSDGVRISYLGTFEDTYNGGMPYFLASNDTDAEIDVNSSTDAERVDGEPADGKMMFFNGVTLPPGEKGLVSIYAFDTDTYEPIPFETADTEIIVSSDDDSRYSQYVPVHMVKEDGAYAVTAEEAYYPDYVYDLMALDQEMAEEEAQNELREANAEEVQAPVVEKIGIYNYPVGRSYYCASVTALVRNPNERTYVHRLSIECEAYDADGNLLGITKPYYTEEFAIAPGETLPYQMSVNEMEFGTEVDHVEISVNDYRAFNEVDLDSERSTWSLEMATDDIALEDISVTEGNRSDSIFERYEAFISGTLVNYGENADEVHVLPILYNSDGEIILSSRHRESDLASGSSVDFEHSFGVAMYDLPGYDHAEIYILK